MNCKKILLIDDDSDDRELFYHALQRINPSIECITARNGEEGVRMLENCQPVPDVIFLDLNMPKMNGQTFLKWIKETTNFNSVPVVIYSTSRNPHDMEETRKMGAAHFITKPMHFDDIIRSIRFVIEKGYAENKNVFCMEFRSE